MSDFDLIDRDKHSVITGRLCRCGWQGDDIITHILDLAMRQTIPMAWWHVERGPDRKLSCNHLAHDRGGECGRETGNWQRLYQIVTGEST